MNGGRTWLRRWGMTCGLLREKASVVTEAVSPSSIFTALESPSQNVVKSSLLRQGWGVEGEVEIHNHLPEKACKCLLGLLFILFIFAGTVLGPGKSTAQARRGSSVRREGGKKAAVWRR